MDVTTNSSKPLASNWALVDRHAKPKTKPVCRPSRRKASLAIVDDMPMRRESTRDLLRAHLRERAQCFAHSAELVGELQQVRDRPRGVIFSVGGRSVCQLALQNAVKRLVVAIEPKPVLILSDREGAEEILAAFRAGARGFVPTNLEPPVVIQAIRLVLSGGAFVPAAALAKTLRRPDTPVRLTGRMALMPERDTSNPRPQTVDRRSDTNPEKEQWHSRQQPLLALIVAGKPNKEIARALAVDEATIKSRVRYIMRKLDVTNRTQIALRARKLGILESSLPSFAPENTNRMR